MELQALLRFVGEGLFLCFNPEGAYRSDGRLTDDVVSGGSPSRKRPPRQSRWAPSMASPSRSAIATVNVPPGLAREEKTPPVHRRCNMFDF